LVGNHRNLPGRNTGIPEILEIPAVTRNSGVLRSGNSTSGKPYFKGGGGPKVEYLCERFRCFVACTLPVGVGNRGGVGYFQFIETKLLLERRELAAEMFGARQ
jgi:hypothetical protein